jgi:AraC-like DNA-binding protein
MIALSNTWSIRSLSATRAKSGSGRGRDEDGGGVEDAGELQTEIVEEKPVAVCPAANNGVLMHHVQEWAIKRKLVSRALDGLAQEAMGALFRKNPLSVDDWSSIMGVKPRRFQREFKLFTDLSPKKILALYHAYRIAFTVADEHNNREKGVIPAYIVDERSKERVMEYVLTHRSALLTAAV